MEYRAARRRRSLEYFTNRHIWPALLLGAGMAAQGAGSFLGGQAEGRNARKARDFQLTQQAVNLYNLARVVYGEERGLSETLRRLPPGIRERFAREQFGIVDEPNVANLERMTPEGLADYIRSKGAGGQGTGSGMLGAYRALGAAEAADQQAQGEQYREGTQRLDQLGVGAENIAREFGLGGERLIDEESARDLKTANRTSLARLNASGFGGSTIAGNQLAANAGEIGLRARGQKLLLRQASTDRLLAARQGRIGTLGQRFAGSSAMRERFAGRRAALRQQPLDLEMGLLTGGIFNPQTNYQPAGGYGFAGALSNVGGGLTTLGGYGLAGGFGGGGQGGFTPPQYTAAGGIPQGHLGFGGSMTGGVGNPYWLRR